MTAKNDTESMKSSKAASLEAAAVIALADTRIQMAGVMRCCLGTVGEEYEGKDGAADMKVSIGMKSQCRHCKEQFTLVEAKPHPIWKPDWLLRGAAMDRKGGRP